MHRVDSAGNLNGKWVAEDASINRPPTELGPDWHNAVQEEIAHFIESMGLVLDKADNTQLAQAAALKTKALIQRIKGKAANYNVTADDAGTLFHCTNAAVTYTLPDAATCAGVGCGFRCNNGYIPTIATVNGQAIIGENVYTASLALTKNNAFVWLFSDGANWIILAASPFIEGAYIGSAGQAWIDVTSSRSNGVTYTNTTGRPIKVAVRGTAVSSSERLDCILGGVEILTSGYPGNAPATCVACMDVPAGYSYSVNWGSFTTISWKELR